MGDEMKVAMSLICLIFAFSIVSCDKLEASDDVYTLYSSNYPHDNGRSGIATFDIAKEPFNSRMCQEAADMYQADFEKNRDLNSDTKMRHWCEKGKFKK
jgi:hypothetical protein